MFSRKTYILAFSLLLGFSVIDSILKFTRSFTAESVQVHRMANQAAMLDKELDAVEEKAGKQNPLRADLAKIQTELAVQSGHYSQNWDWWEDAAAPLGFLLSLLYVIKSNNSIFGKHTKSPTCEPIQA